MFSKKGSGRQIAEQNLFKVRFKEVYLKLQFFS